MRSRAMKAEADADIIYVPQGFGGNWYMWKKGTPATFAAITPDGIVRCFKDGDLKETISHSGASNTQDHKYDTARMWLDRAEVLEN
jgi:hypothetical protein